MRTAVKYRKKPIVIEARQLGRDYDEDCDIADWCGGRAVGEDEGDTALVVIETLEGVMVGNVGDWIIRGVQGEFYPCKPDIFEETYEVAE
jgi:hypothetical protein